MLRTIVALLVVANLAFFAWTRGWLSPWLITAPAGDAGQREPQRLQRQIRPDSIVIVGKSPSPSVPATECLQTDAIDSTAIDAAVNALQEAAVPGLDWQRLPAVDGQWTLRLPQVSEAQRAPLGALGDPALQGLQPCAR